MAQLTNGMYGHEFYSTSNLFGLRCGQMRGGDTKMTHNSGWYNKSGEKLGFGDLSTKDFQRISSELENGELFIILGELDSFWNFVIRPSLIGSMARTKPTVEASGVDYVAEHARYVIARNQLYRIDRYGDSKEEISEWRGLQFKVLKPAAVKLLMTAGVLA
ncbi:MAG: hypothetical protein AAB564_00320 [Patescibacteria group bacterium]